MDDIFCCLCRFWSAQGFNSGHERLKELPSVVLDTKHMGNDVVIVKNGRRICGIGAALANVPIVQDKAYFEVKLQQTGVWALGLATRNVDLNSGQLGNDGESWVLRSDGKVYTNGEEKITISEMPQEGDVIGISYDHIEMNFYLNGNHLQSPVIGIRGTLYPVFFVDEGAIMDVLFSDFFHRPPSGYDKIMIEQSLL